MDNIIILKSNSLLNLYQAYMARSWAFSPRKNENANKALFTWAINHIVQGNFVLGFCTESDNSGFIQYGTVRTIPKNEKTIDDPWDGEFLFPFKVDWNFIKPRAQIIPKKLINSLDMPRRFWPTSISHEQFLQILKL